MFSRHYVGRDLFNAANYGPRQPVSRITLFVDDDNVFTAGDDTGMELTAKCPYATESMAKSLLSIAKGVQYTAYEATAANLDPAAELGDGVTLDGIYSVLAQISDNGDGYPDISFPGEDLIEEEYPGIETPEENFDRKIATTRSLISKTAEEIRLEVAGVEDEISYIQLDLDSITSRVQDAEGNIATLELTANSLRSEISGKLDEDYAQTLIEQTLEGIELSVSSKNGSTTFKLTADGTTLSTKTLDLTVDAVNVSGTLKAKNVEVEAAAIAGTLSAKALALDGALELTEDGEVYGYMGVNEVKGGPVMSDSTGNIGVIVTNNAAKISYREDKMIWVANGGCYSSYTMQVYSDRRLKNSINYDLSKAEALFPLLKPCSFIMNSDKDGKTNWGFISNEVIESATSVGLDAEKLALIGKSGEMHTLAYGQITALNTHMIQKLMARMDALEGKNNEV